MILSPVQNWAMWLKLWYSLHTIIIQTMNLDNFLIIYLRNKYFSLITTNYWYGSGRLEVD